MQDSPQHFSLDSFLRDTVKFYLNILGIVKKGIFHYWKHILVLFVLFGFSFFLTAIKTKTFYNASSSYVINFLPKKVFGDRLHDLEKMIQNQEYESVANSLSISLNASNHLLSLEAKNIKGTPLHEDFTHMNVPFYMYASVKSLDSLAIIQDAITRYLCEDSIIIEFMENEKLSLIKELEFINQKKIYLDSLLENHNNTSSEDLTVLINLSKDNWNQHTKLEKKISCNKAVTLLKTFQGTEALQSKQLTSLGIKYALSFLLLSILITSFLYWHNNPSNEF